MSMILIIIKSFNSLKRGMKNSFLLLFTRRRRSVRLRRVRVRVRKRVVIWFRNCRR